MREHFAEALVAGYEPLIGTLELPDADDRHVLAAAIRSGAQSVAGGGDPPCSASVRPRSLLTALPYVLYYEQRSALLIAK